MVIKQLNKKHKNSARFKLKNKLTITTITAIINCFCILPCVVVAYIIPLNAFFQASIKL